MKPSLSVLTFCVLTIGLLAIAPLSADDKEDKAKEAKNLQGTWKIISAEFSGKGMELKEVGIDQIVVSGEKMTLKMGDREVATYSFELYPDREPKGLLWKKETKEGTGLHPTIYEVDGTKLKLCFPLLSVEKPTEAPKPPENFETKDKPLGLLVAEREKP